MANRFRNERLEIKLTKEEKALFNKKFEMSKSKNMSHFIRKCVLEKEIFVIDMAVFREMQHLLGVNANNINQIAKQANTTGVIYHDDIEQIKKENEEISRKLIVIQRMLSGKFSNRTA